MMVMDELQNIPKNWDLKPFKSIITFGKGLSITKENLIENGVQCLNYGEIHSKFPFEVLPSTDTLPFVSPDYLVTDVKALVQPGDMVFADTSEDIAGAGNFTQIIGNEPIFAGYHTIITRPNVSVNSRYLAYVLDSEEFRNQIRSRVKGVKVYSITKNILGNTRVWFPDLDTQNSIAKYLDDQTRKITTLLREKQNFIDLLNEKRQALISHYVTKGLDEDVSLKDSGIEWIGKVPEHWDLVRAKQVAEIFIPQRNKPDLNEITGTPWITMKEMGYEFLREPSLYVDAKAIVSAGSKILREGSVIASCVGEFGIASINDNPVIINQQLQAFLPFNIDKSYLRYVVEISNHYFENISTAATISYVNQKGFENLPVPFPPLAEQKLIVQSLTDELNQIDDIISEFRFSIGLLQEHRTALISAAVTGKIDVRNYNKSEAL